MENFKKTLTTSEVRNKIVTFGYVVESKLKGGAQASINIPSDFFDYLKEKSIIVKDERIEQIINTESIQYEAYNLSNDYKLKFEGKIVELLEIDQNTEYGFFIITAATTKAQIRYTLYNKVDEQFEENYKWLKDLIDRGFHEAELTFICNTIDRELTVQYDSKIDDRISETPVNKSESQEAYKFDNIPLQVLYFGAPGTGKSHNIEKIIKDHLNIPIPEDVSIDELPYVFRSTMFADYSYHDFIGSVMPIIDENDKVNYDFMPGAFTKALMYAFKNPKQCTYLILEEMSRANMASVFGDVFQLLDREPDGRSTFSINNDLIAKKLNEVDSRFYNNEENRYNKIYLPENLSILGTVNSTDQNVFVMDTAFKRRFDFVYVPTDPVNGEDGSPLNNFTFKLHGKEVKWVDFYTKINNFILEEALLNEDKQIGQFFIKGILDTTDISKNTEKVKNKLLNYLWLDVNPTIFTGKKIFNKEYRSFSEIYNAFDDDQKQIFNLDVEDL